ncbi:MAG: LamG-like jellyroll fold domain-containing protein [Bacteroidota bacterium]
MKFSKLYQSGSFLLLALAATMVSSCQKDGNPNKLPSVSTDSYAGKVDGFNTSEEIYPTNLVAYWSFDNTTNEKLSSTAVTSAAGNTYITGGVRGQALALNNGYLYYASQFNAFKVAALKSFTVSAWVQILNNGSKKTMVFQLARPGIFNGNINFVLETNARAATVTDAITIHPTFTGQNGGTQDNLNASNGTFLFQSPKIGANVWAHMVITYDATTGIFQIWGNGVKIGVPAYQSRGTGTSLYNSFEPSEVIFGGNYNVIPGKTVSTDTSFGAMTGSIDEVRIYNTILPDAYIISLYKLGLAGK